MIKTKNIDLVVDENKFIDQNTKNKLRNNMDCTLYISPDGDNKLDGLSAKKENSLTGPFATLERARNEIRALKNIHSEATFE
ncbi:MAG: hypothetical protein JXR78_06475 [Victivallales bacterium]|nr:hypothetical protein [Victivallales bacterium]